MFPAPPLSTPVAEALDVVRALADPEKAPAGPHERAAWLVGLRQIVDAAETAFTRVLSDFDAAGDGQVLHAAASTPSWLRGALGMAGAEASERVRIARASQGQLSPAMDALLCRDDSAGQAPISYEHVRSIHRTLRALPPSARDEASDTLTELAPQLGVDDLRAAGRHLRHVVDPDGSRRHAEEDFGRRWLSLAPLLDGMHSIDGVLDAETAGHLNAALAPFLVPTGPDDVRTTEQRRADGLADIVCTAVKSGELPQLSGSSVALQVDVPLLALTGGSTEPARIAPNGKTPVWLTTDCAQRMSCDASVRRILLDPSGIPLDLGREARIFSSAQRRALAARDRGCRFPGCSRPAIHTDAHHVVPWTQGGATDLSNGVLLCRHHHRQVHEGGWSIHPVTSGSDAKGSGAQRSGAQRSGAQGALEFIGPAGQRLPSPVPTARGPSP